MIHLPASGGLRVFVSAPFVLTGVYATETTINHGLNTDHLVKVVLEDTSNNYVVSDYCHYWAGSGGPAYNNNYFTGTVYDKNSFNLETYYSLAGTFIVKVFAI
jgi:hypothetical protein